MTAPQNKIRIAIYAGSIPSTVFIETLIEQACAIGYDIYLFGTKKDPAFLYQNPNIHIYASPEHKWQLPFFVLKYQARLLLANPKRLFKLRRHLLSVEPVLSRRIRLWAKFLPAVTHLPDIFHLQWAKSIQDWIFVKQLFGVRLALSLRGSHINISPDQDPRLAKAFQQLFPAVDAFHAVSKAIAHKAEMLGADPDRIHVLYSPQRPISPIEPKIKSQTINMLSVGRIHWVKGYRLALEALSLLSARGHRIQYSIIGDGPLEELKYLAAHLGIADLVSFFGAKPHEMVLEHMRRAQLLLLPSYEEGVANVVLEAMSLGLPVISSNCGGMPEVVIPGKTGWLFEKGNAVDLASKIETYLLSSAEELTQITQSAQKRVADMCNPDVFREKLAAFYAGILEEAPTLSIQNLQQS